MGEEKKKQERFPLNGLSSWMSGFSQITGKILSAEKKESKDGKDALVDFLKTTPEALEAFETAYRKGVIDDSGYSYDETPNAKQAAAAINREMPDALNALVCRIVKELIALTPVYRYDGKNVSVLSPPALPDHEMVTKEEVMAVPAEIRPACTGNLMKKDCDAEEGLNGRMLLSMYVDSQSPKRSRTARKQAYDRFRSGLDLLDLDGLMYAMIDKNPNSMGHWLPALVEAVKKQNYFKIPATTIIKVPLTLLQLTRLDYGTHTPTTLKIVDDYCYKVFGLDENETYFVRTGTCSSKFDFRNTKVSGSKEIHELGEYLLYNHSRGAAMAGPLCQPSIYGMQTTVEWAVREYIEPKEKLPEIYFGLPLRLEMRVFIDTTEKRVLGIAPYWDPKTMKQRFSMEDDFRNPDKIHDYVTYSTYEPTLMAKYEAYKDKVVHEIETMLPNLDLEGQWSLDVMLNGTNPDGSDDIYLIDMALACNSALQEYVPYGLLKPYTEDWIPEIPEMHNTNEEKQSKEA